MTQQDRQTNYHHLIIGGGEVADRAARAIRQHDPVGSIGILSSDLDEPYSRPPLSKKLWTQDDFTLADVPLGTAKETGAEAHLRTEVVAVDPVSRQVRTADNRTFGYQKLLLATGSTPKRIEAPDDRRVIFYRTLDDYRTLRELASKDSRVVVLGGGYIGNELAAGLATIGVTDVTLVFTGERLGGERFPADLAARWSTLFTDHGVRLVPGRKAQRITGGEVLQVVLDDDSTLEADVVVVGLGVEPNLQLAKDAGLEVDDGIVVDEYMRTSDEHVWAAGDIVEYPDRILGRTSVQHVDHARESGTTAGRAMAGSPEPHTYTPFISSTAFGVRWEAVGRADSELDVLEVPLDDERVVVYYRDEQGRAVGVLLWQSDDEEAVDKARQVVADAPGDADELRRRIR